MRLKVFLDTPVGRKIKQEIILAIAHLRQLYPLKFHLIFPVTFLDCLFPNQELDCTDLRKNNEVFNKFMNQ